MYIALITGRRPLGAELRKEGSGQRQICGETERGFTTKERENMKYFIDTHDKTKGSFPIGELSPEEFLAQFDALEAAAPQYGVNAHAAHVNLEQGKAFCFMCGPDEESIRKAHEAVHLLYDSITEVKRVTGADMRVGTPACRQKRT